MLLAAGAEPNPAGNLGETPLSKAERTSPELAALIRAHGGHT